MQVYILDEFILGNQMSTKKTVDFEGICVYLLLSHGIDSTLSMDNANCI